MTDSLPHRPSSSGHSPSATPSSEASPGAEPDASSRPSSRSSRFGRPLLYMLVIGLVLCGLGYLSHGKVGIEKTITKLVFPLGLLWWMLAARVLDLLFSARRYEALMAGCLWAGLTFCSSSPCVNFFTSYLESREVSFDPSVDPPLDVLVVLGGGTTQGPTRAQAGQSGDRVLYAAQLQIQGHTHRLITTGDPLPGRKDAQRSSPSQQALEIWTQLGIARESIETLPGYNTYREIQSLKDYIQRNDLAGKRVGLLTSASHLPRAMRLARAADLHDLVPVAADRRSSSAPRTFLNYLPSADALAQFARCQHEFMARLVNR